MMNEMIIEKTDVSPSVKNQESQRVGEWYLVTSGWFCNCMERTVGVPRFRNHIDTAYCKDCNTVKPSALPVQY